MQLTPRQPPGRKSRKARAFSTEIRRLRGLGYSTEAIREALADVGVHVSKSTVQREASRPAAAVGDTVEQESRSESGNRSVDNGMPGTARSSHPIQGE